MPITSSAKKALRSSLRKRVFNRVRKDAFKALEKKIRKLVAGKNITEAEKLLPKAYEALDKAAKMNTIKKGAADRKKSRLALSINKAIHKTK